MDLKSIKKVQRLLGICRDEKGFGTWFQVRLPDESPLVLTLAADQLNQKPNEEKLFELPQIDGEEAKKFSCELVIPKDASDRDATKAWTTAIGKLWQFRQKVGVGRDQGKGKPDRSRWPEANSIREIIKTHSSGHEHKHVARQSFPRAVFGLPIITHFNSTREPADTIDTILYPVVGGEKQDRMVSPLILKAMWTGKDYQPIALLLLRDTDMGLRLEGNGRTLRDMPTVDDWWSKAKRNAMTGAREVTHFLVELAMFYKIFSTSFRGMVWFLCVIRSQQSSRA